MMKELSLTSSSSNSQSNSQKTCKTRKDVSIYIIFCRIAALVVPIKMVTGSIVKDCLDAKAHHNLAKAPQTYVTWTRVQVSDTGMCPTRVLLNFCKFFHIFEGSEHHTNVRICVGHGCWTWVLPEK